MASSAGGIAALREILHMLPPDFPAPIVAAQHMAGAFSNLAPVLQTRCRLSVAFARNGERLRAGRLYVAPPGRHVVVCEEQRLMLSDGPKVNHVRPSADLLFESAASAFGPRVIAVVLTGMGRDGSHGARAVKRHGGIVVVQDPATGEASSMPACALQTGCVDLQLEVHAIAHALVSLVMVRGTQAELGLPRQQAKLLAT